MQMPAVANKPPGKTPMGDSKKMPESMGDSTPAEVIAQKWDDQKESLVRTALRAPAAEIDVRSDALLANRRTLDDPELVSVQPGESVLLRLIAAASATNFYVDTGSLEAEILAVDGKAARLVKGNSFQLGTAQRLDRESPFRRMAERFRSLRKVRGPNCFVESSWSPRKHLFHNSRARPPPPRRRWTILRKRGFRPSIRFLNAASIARFPRRLVET